MPGPISPEGLALYKSEIPEKVFEIVNTLLARSWDGRRAMVRQEDIVVRLCKDLHIERQDVFDRHLLDFEELYRRVGWIVEYDKPGYNEDGEAWFTFKINLGKTT